MPANPAEGIAAWKRPVDVALQVMQALVEGVEKAREIQHAAASDTRAWLQQTRSALETTGGPADLTALQGQFMAQNLSRAAGYWSRLAANGRDTHARILAIVMDGTRGAPLLTPSADAQAMNTIIDAGYKQWLEALQQVYGTAKAH
jgi:hypothetical protein